MQISKIGSKNTYHKCIKELHQAKYIFYHPSSSRFHPVKISIIRLDKKEENTNYQQLDLFNQTLISGKPFHPSSRGDIDGISSLKIGTHTVPKLSPISTDFDTGTVPKMGHIIKQNSKQENSVCNTPTLIFEKNREINQKLNNLLAPNHSYEELSPPSVPPSAIVIPTELNNQSSSLQNISDGGISQLIDENNLLNQNTPIIPYPSATNPPQENHLLAPNHSDEETSPPFGGRYRGGLDHLTSFNTPPQLSSRLSMNEHLTSSGTISSPVISTEQNNHFTSSHTPSDGEICPEANDLVSVNNINGMPQKKPALNRKQQKSNPPTISIIEAFFKSHNYPLHEAQKFYYYNQGKNWMLTDKLPIHDWQSLAHKWMLNTKHTTKHSLPPPGGDTEGGSGSSGDLSEAIQFLYDLYLQGTPISKQLQPEFADHLQLEITEKIMTEAIQRRINQLSGSNERSQNQLWSVYMQEDFQNPLIQNDQPNLLSLAKRLAVLKHFQKQKSKGITTLSL